MGKMLLGFAVIVAAVSVTAPATAGTPEEPFVGSSGFSVGFGQPSSGDHHFDRRSGHGGGIWINGGEWARYNNPSFQSDGYNDWWHDRPDRAYPAWVRNNQNCARQWYAGTTLRC